MIFFDFFFFFLSLRNPENLMTLPFAASLLSWVVSHELLFFQALSTNIFLMLIHANLIFLILKTYKIYKTFCDVNKSRQSFDHWAVTEEIIFYNYLTLESKSVYIIFLLTQGKKRTNKYPQDYWYKRWKLIVLKGHFHFSCCNTLRSNEINKCKR